MGRNRGGGGQRQGGQGGHGGRGGNGGRGGGYQQQQYRGVPIEELVSFSWTNTRFAATLHDVDIVAMDGKGMITLTSGGRQTRQTMEGMNAVLAPFCLAVVADCEQPGVWIVTNGKGWMLEYYDEMCVSSRRPAWPRAWVLVVVVVVVVVVSVF